MERMNPEAEDMDDQMADMYYTMTCDICGEPVVRSVALSEFQAHSSVHRAYMRDISKAIRAHNMTHLEAVQPSLAQA